MTDNLVKRLREVGGLDPAAELCSYAADRIEQLTDERDKAERLGKSGGYRATPEHSWAEWCDELYRDLNTANDRIEQLEAALREIGTMNALRDRWSDPIENVILAALEGKDG